MALCKTCLHTGVHATSEVHGSLAYCVTECEKCDAELDHWRRASEQTCVLCGRTDVTTVPVGTRINVEKYQCEHCGTRPLTAFKHVPAA